MQLLHQLNHLDVWFKAGRVFVYAFLAAWTLTGNALTREAAIGALAAGLSALYNYSKQTLLLKAVK